ncbi:hypothetical protein [Phaeobacter inhibens]|uniref:hypothetical protein n=1 Tax=Phaeobacter inhibens TaxID=221822 RepID=UPI0021A87EE0|nr:hypothetical protein [Phaeobacter inhibens]
MIFPPSAMVTAVSGSGRCGRVYYHHRNLLLLYRQAAGWLFWPVLLLILPKWILKVRHHPGVRWAYLRLTWLAVRDGLLRAVGAQPR